MFLAVVVDGDFVAMTAMGFAGDEVHSVGVVVVTMVLDYYYCYQGYLQGDNIKSRVLLH